MHELAITEGILEAAIPAAEKAGAKKILEIRLKIGELSGVIPACIEEYLHVAAKGTIAEEAKLSVTRIPAAIRCNICGRESEPERRKGYCPFCGSSDITLLRGREYYVDSLEVE